MKLRHISFILFVCIVISCGRTPQLKQTSLTLSEIKAIGELVTAEYYGEVLSGLSIIQHQENEPWLSSTYSAMQSDYRRYSNQIDAKYKKNLDKWSNKKAEADTNKNFNKSDRFQKKIDELKAEVEKEKDKFKSKLTRDSEKRLKLLHQRTGVSKRRIVQAIQKENLGWESFRQKYSKALEKKYKKEQKNDLVYLARGSVKAGYNLQKLDSTQIFRSPGGDTLYLLDFDPFITDVIINPYFYFPDSIASQQSANADVEEMLFGFHLIYAEGEKNISLKDINEVKDDCKLQLYQSAIQKNIYDLAKQNAESALSGFFSVFHSKGSAMNVFISHSKYFHLKADYLYDRHIDSLEFEEIKLLLEQDRVTLDDQAFDKQKLNYQIKKLDDFMLELHTQTQLQENYVEWDSLSSAYLIEHNLISKLDLKN